MGDVRQRHSTTAIKQTKWNFTPKEQKYASHDTASSSIDCVPSIWQSLEESIRWCPRWNYPRWWCPAASWRLGQNTWWLETHTSFHRGRGKETRRSQGEVCCKERTSRFTHWLHWARGWTNDRNDKCAGQRWSIQRHGASVSLSKV